LLQRRIRTGEEITDRTLRTPTRIILDESIIPKKYAKVILHCMYTDVVDLSVLHCSPSVGSLSEVQALVAGKPNMTRAEEAMELYHIALFLEFNMLAQEPNLLSGTAHSVNKRGVKRRDLDMEELREILSSLLPFVRIEHILPINSEVLSDAMKRGLISTPPSDMLPTTEGGKSNAWLRQKNAGIYVRPRLFSPYVEEAKSVLDEMMVEQTDLVRLRMVRMSNVPDTLYMVNNAVPQCCHMISHQQISSNQSSPPSVVANEIPVPRLLIMKDMVRRLQELRHTEQVQRAYALNCGEGATVSYEIQIRVLREFGLADAAAELLQNPHKFFPDERFGDESPLLTMRQPGRCRVNSTPPAETMFTDLDSFVAFHPPLPPPPPPYHPPATPIHNQLKAGWKQRPPSQHPSRSFSYPCNHSLFHSRTAPKAGPPPVYLPSVKAAPPDCTSTAGLGRQTVAAAAATTTSTATAAAAAAAASEKQVRTQPVLNDLMPDIAVGVSTLSLKDRRLPELAVDTELSQSVSEAGPGPPQHLSCIPQRHTHTSRKKHTLEQKTDARENPQEYPDFYDFSNAACRPSTPAPSRHTPSPSQGGYFGPDLYSHNKASPSGLKSAYLPGQTSPKKQEEARREYPLSPDGHLHRQKNEPIHLDVVEQPPQRSDFPLATPENASTGPAHVRGRTAVETDLTFGLTPNRPSFSACSSEAPEERSSRRLADSESLGHGAQRNTDLEREDSISRGRRSPSKPDFLYKKSAL
ncbi:BTBD7 isoform 7, partial [Pongo abelii]